MNLANKFFNNDQNLLKWALIVIIVIGGLSLIKPAIEQENKAIHAIHANHMYLTINDFNEEVDCVYISDSIGNQLVMIDGDIDIMMVLHIIDEINNEIKPNYSISYISERYWNLKLGLKL